jgi:hypothetical protein
MERPTRRWDEIGKIFRKDREKYTGFFSFGLMGHVQMMGYIQSNGDIDLVSQLVRLPIQRVLMMGLDLEANLGWVDEDMLPNPPREDRWVQVGRLFFKAEDQYTGFMSLGLLGQVPMIGRPDRYNPDRINILSLAHRLFLNQIDLLGKDYEDTREHEPRREWKEGA